ncbi:MAG TPA: ABC transporter substrate-binding protein [Burkholderiaceae bacterium]|nr:ABC transporter substrate-binding protein [Burkholderiaceae bacterium]
MSLTRRSLLKLAAASGTLAAFPSILRAQTLERKDVHIAVGGKALTYYLPLSVAELLGYFEDEGLDVKVSDFAGGSKALQAVVGGSAHVVSGAFEHTLNLQSKKQFYRAFALQGRAPMIGLGVSTKVADYNGPEDLKGMKVGVTAPGSSTNMLVNFYLAQNGLKADDVAIVGVGGGSGAVSALRSGQIDAISNVDPVISTLEHSGDLELIADTRSVADTQTIFGGNMPAGCLYAPEKFLESNPGVAQALTNAIVRADKWIHSTDPDEIVDTMPESYLLGNRDVYLAAVSNSIDGLSPDGLIPDDGPETALNALAAFIDDFPVDDIELDRIWTNDFAKKANEQYPNG